MAIVKYNEVIELIKSLPLSEMKEVKDFAEFLKAKKTVKPKASFSEFCGIIDKKDIKAMMSAIEEGCERVDTNEW
jgi:hypothetical protein